MRHEDAGKRLWSKFLKDAENSPQFRDVLRKERRLFHDLACRNELGEHVTVMCCGDGREMGMLLDLHREFPQIKELNGVDLLSVSIDQVRERVREKLQDIEGVNVRLLQEDATDTSITPHSQDTVTCMLTMVNFNDETITKFLKHVDRILKPGGKFLFSVYNHEAFDTRMDLYAKMGAPIESADPESGLVVFGKDFEEASFSRQFGEDQLQSFADQSGLHLERYEGDGITHMGVLQKASVHANHERTPVYQQILATAASVAFLLGSIHMSMEKTKEILADDTDAKIMEIAPGQYRIVNFKAGKMY